MHNMTDEIPLIWTAKGNLPIAELEHEVKWERTDTYIKVVEIYRYQGEVVKEGAHVLMLQSLESCLFADAA